MRRLAVILAVLVAAAAGGVAYAFARGGGGAAEHGAAQSRPFGAAATWARGAKAAPAFALTDQHGRRVSLAALRGRPAIVTFIDPVCRDLCPLEAKVLMKAARSLPAAQRPAIVAVSVNPPADTRQNFALDVTHWKLAAGWRWGTGTQAQLAPVWHDYDIGVQTLTQKIAGVTVHKVVHTEASYVIDATGHERALFLYPFSVADVAAAIRAAST